VEREWSNIQNIINKAACESLGKIKIQRRRKYLKIWDDEIKTDYQPKQRKRLERRKDSRGRSS
jgi:hypothetical protein